MSTSCEGSERRSIPAKDLERARAIVKHNVARWFRRDADPRHRVRFGLSDLVGDTMLRIVKLNPSPVT